MSTSDKVINHGDSVFVTGVLTNAIAEQAMKLMLAQIKEKGIVIKEHEFIEFRWFYKPPRRR